MTDVAIRIENLRKRYRIVAGPKTMQGTKTLRDALTWRSRLLARKVGQSLRRVQEPLLDIEEFWALDDISVNIKAGEVVGIIGRNGAGKSTLLKILSRITEPTEGRITLHGRIGSLLEVGTGFHPELSGRENIFLNGAILGMKKAEIARKFDEIVAFSEIEQFLDTPVKRYSSGMYVRLAFAVAAHLEPEILLVDEVLAVGDASFQKKCLGKMGEVARGGRTVLFVSHNMSSIVALCKVGLLLDRGKLVHYGDINTAVSGYLSGGESHGEHIFTLPIRQHKMHFTSMSLHKNGELTVGLNNSETLTLRTEFTVNEKLTGAQIAFEFLNETGECIFASTNQDQTGEKTNLLTPGRYISRCAAPLGLLRAGRYHIKVSASIPGTELLDDPDQTLVFDVYDDSSPIIKLAQNRRGVIIPILPWEVERQ